MSRPLSAFPQFQAPPIEYLPGSPQGLYNAPVGRLVVDTVNGNLWIKTTPELDNYGWVQLGGGGGGGGAGFAAGTGTYMGTTDPPNADTAGATVGAKYLNVTTQIWWTYFSGGWG